MKFAYTRLVTEDVSSLAGFYEKLLGTPPKGNDDYVELHPEGAILAIVSRKAADYMHGGDGPQAPISSAILEFEVDDVDAERGRVDAFVTDWLSNPRICHGAIAPCCFGTRTATRSIFSSHPPRPESPLLSRCWGVDRTSLGEPLNQYMP